MYLDHINNESPIPSWCNVTFDRQVLDDSNALVFHIAGSDLNMDDLPPRCLNVPWVYFLIEPPVYMLRDTHEFNGYFNRTMSYRYLFTYFVCTALPFFFISFPQQIVSYPSGSGCPIPVI